MSHRVSEEWMGDQVETLEDLLRPGLRAVCIGINPAPPSVAAGHYYQGKAGQRFFARLRRAGLLSHAAGWEDDLAFAQGIGFTDIVKRPTANAAALRRDEFEHGRELLRVKIEKARPRLALFTFKKTAEVLFGRFAGNGLIDGREIGRAPVFVMPGPYAAREEVDRLVGELRRLISDALGS